jgi:hypothetical protein
MPNTPILGITYPAGLPGSPRTPPVTSTPSRRPRRPGSSPATTPPAPARPTPAGLSPRRSPPGGDEDRPERQHGPVKGGVRKVGQRVEVRIRATRTGSAITPGATGNFADVPVMSLAAGYQPASTVYGTFVQPGTTGGVCRVETSGLIQITNAFNAASTIRNGDVVQIQVDFFIN